MKWLKRSMIEIIIVSSQLFIVTVSGAIMYLILYFQTRNQNYIILTLQPRTIFDIGRGSSFMAKVHPSFIFAMVFSICFFMLGQID